LALQLAGGHRVYDRPATDRLAEESKQRVSAQSHWKLKPNAAGSSRLREAVTGVCFILGVSVSLALFLILRFVLM
jgi:hypothetical protein